MKIDLRKVFAGVDPGAPGERGAIVIAKPRADGTIEILDARTFEEETPFFRSEYMGTFTVPDDVEKMLREGDERERVIRELSDDILRRTINDFMLPRGSFTAPGEPAPEPEENDDTRFARKMRELRGG